MEIEKIADRAWGKVKGKDDPNFKDLDRSARYHLLECVERGGDSTPFGCAVASLCDAEEVASGPDVPAEQVKSEPVKKPTKPAKESPPPPKKEPTEPTETIESLVKNNTRPKLEALAAKAGLSAKKMDKYNNKEELAEAILNAQSK